jgi:hypothetical protein
MPSPIFTFEASGGTRLSAEIDTKKLLEYRESMEAKLAELEQEIIDIRRAVAIVDKLIVSQGFRTPTRRSRRPPERRRRSPRRSPYPRTGRQRP